MEHTPYHPFLDLAWKKLLEARGPGFAHLYRTLSTRSADAAVDAFLRVHRERREAFSWLTRADVDELFSVADPAIQKHLPRVRNEIERGQLEPPAVGDRPRFGRPEAFPHFYRQAADWSPGEGLDVLRLASDAELATLAPTDWTRMLAARAPRIRRAAMTTLSRLRPSAPAC